MISLDGHIDVISMSAVVVSETGKCILVIHLNESDDLYPLSCAQPSRSFRSNAEGLYVHLKHTYGV